MKIKSIWTHPVIGITMDSEDQGVYSHVPWYALHKNYCESVAHAGGLPLPLPHLPELVSAYLNRIDGVLVTGGAFDVDPALFGATRRHATVKLKEERTRFELSLIQGVLTCDKPLLGICGGAQLLNVVLGGTLVQHLPEEIPGGLAHEQPNPHNEVGHDIAVIPGSLLHHILGQATVAVNSAHHQAVKTVGSGVVVSARASDGVVEAIEVPARRFCLGVQWHPEYGITLAEGRLFTALVQAAGTPGC